MGEEKSMERDVDISVVIISGSGVLNIGKRRCQIYPIFFLEKFRDGIQR